MFAIVLALILSPGMRGQDIPFSVKRFFEEDSLLHFRLKTDFREMQRNRQSDDYRGGTMYVLQNNTAVLEVPVLVRARGELRREMCFPPPVMIDFKASDSTPLRKLGRLKLVASCSDEPYNDQLLIREYLVYRMYQLLTPLSFRVRLVRMEYDDDQKQHFSKARYAFFLEDVDDMAKRNDYRETDAKFATAATDRKANTLFALFQYMIGNTDWAIPLSRNLKLVYPKDQPNAPPTPVPYDFDYCGVVNASYAVPYEQLPITHVRDRYYMGFERTEAEIMEALELFRRNQEPIYTLIRDCPYLREDGKKDIIHFLESFFKMINNRNEVVDTFIKNARKK